MSRKLTKEEFIERARKVHGNKYDYSKVEYKNIKEKVCIICPTHGEFWQNPKVHLDGFGCAKCSGKYQYTTEEFIEKARKVHDDKYDYSQVEYINTSTKVCIICPTHGEFWQTPNSHLDGQGCIKCSGVAKSNTKEFIEKARKVHGDKYDYSKVEYINNRTKICIICPIHGEFWQTPHSHLDGQGCSKCSGIAKSNTKEFIERARKVHGNKYDYSKVEYVNNSTKVCIICPTHGEFWQKPNNHLQGQGCPKCKASHLENEMRIFLLTNNIEFEEQKKFDWLDRQSLDFYLPQYNVSIECQGKQHFGIDGWGESFEIIQERDNRKRKLCEENGIQLLYYSNLGIEYPYEVFENKEKLLEAIVNKN